MAINFKFKDFVKDEGLDKNKNKSWIRTGWDGRQDHLDFLEKQIDDMRKLSISNFEKFEKTRSDVVTLNELIADNKIAVAKSADIHEQNVELLEENKKINNALSEIAKDIATFTITNGKKDREIAALKRQLAKK